MKTMMMTIVKAAAKWVLGYLPEVVLWAVKYCTNKAADSDKAMRILNIVSDIATDAALVARIMEDGNMTGAEEAVVESRAAELADRVKGLL